MDWLGFLGAVGGLAGLASAYFSWLEWKKTNKKIAMLNDGDRANEVLPAWFTSRMMNDYWLFGLLMADGSTIAIIKVESISEDGRWIDVILATSDRIEALKAQYPNIVYAIADDRTDASIQVCQVVAAVELQTS